MLGISTTNARVGGFRGGISAEAKTIYNRIIADGGVSNLSRLNFFVKGLKSIYGDLANVPVCYDAHWIGYKLGSGTGATAGQAAAKLYSLTVAGDAVQATAASQPLLLSHNGASSDNYWYGSGVSGNYNSTPNASANRITGDIEIIARVKITNQSTTQTIIAKNVDGSNFSYWFGISGTNNLRLIFSQDGTVTITATSTLAQPFSTTDIGYVKVTKVSSTGIVKFFTSTDGIIYTQLGADVASTAGAMFNGNASVKIGAYDTSNLFPFFGSIYRATISNSIGGAPVVDFNPATYNASTSQTAWTSSTGEVWTINTGTATTGYKSALVSRTLVQGDGVDDNLASGTLSISGAKTNYLATNILNPIPLSTHYLIDAKNASENQVNLIYKDSSVVRMYTNTFINFSVITHNRLQLFTGLVDSTSSLTKTNNSNTATGTLSNKNITQIFIFSNQIGVTNGNAIINSYILSSVADTTIQQTATYNLVRSLNENAF